MAKAKQSKGEKMKATMAAGLDLPKSESARERVPEAAAQAFETAATGLAAHVRPGPRRASAGRTRRDIPVDQLERLNALIPVALATKVRMKCAAQRLSLSQAMSDALETWVGLNGAEVAAK